MGRKRIKIYYVWDKFSMRHVINMHDKEVLNYMIFKLPEHLIDLVSLLFMTLFACLSVSSLISSYISAIWFMTSFPVPRGYSLGD